jgi:hypothetical protein
MISRCGSIRLSLIGPRKFKQQFLRQKAQYAGYAEHIPAHRTWGAYYRERRTPPISEVPGNGCRVLRECAEGPELRVRSGPHTQAISHTSADGVPEPDSKRPKRPNHMCRQWRVTPCTRWRREEAGRGACPPPANGPSAKWLGRSCPGLLCPRNATRT